MIDKYTEHYEHIQDMHVALRDYSWSRSQTRNDSAFITWLDKEMLKVSNEAYRLTQV